MTDLRRTRGFAGTTGGCAPAGLVASLLAACAPVEPPEVALCKFALERTLADPPAEANAIVTNGLDGTTVELIFPDAGRQTTATCDVAVSRYAVRLEALSIAGTRVPDRTLAPIRADWASKEDAGKLYQL
jgi:hypothetical protein